MRCEGEEEGGEVVAAHRVLGMFVDNFDSALCEQTRIVCPVDAGTVGRTNDAIWSSGHSIHNVDKWPPRGCVGNVTLMSGVVEVVPVVSCVVSACLPS